MNLRHIFATFTLAFCLACGSEENEGSRQAQLGDVDKAVPEATDSAPKKQQENHS